MKLDFDLDVLIIEDDPYDAELTVSALQKQSSNVRTLVLTDGAEAIDFLRSTGKFSGRKLETMPSVVLLDLNLPKVSGLEVLETAKRENLLPNIPIVIFSSSHEDCDIITSYRQGANSYIVKPMDPEEYRRVVTEVAHYWTQLNARPTAHFSKVFNPTPA